MKRVVLVLLLVSLLAASCGGGDKDKDLAAAAGGATSTTVDGKAADGGGANGSTTTTAKGSKNTTTTTAKAGTPTTAGGAPSSTTTRAPFPVKMSLEKKCVRRGATGDAQVLNVVTRPEDTVAYSTEYSDHSNELSNPSYKSGSGYGKAGTDGKYKVEWKLPDNAPTGTATLHTIADGRLQPLLTFKVVGLTGSC